MAFPRTRCDQNHCKNRVRSISIPTDCSLVLVEHTSVLVNTAVLAGNIDLVEYCIRHFEVVIDLGYSWDFDSLVGGSEHVLESQSAQNSHELELVHVLVRKIVAANIPVVVFVRGQRQQQAASILVAARR